MGVISPEEFIYKGELDLKKPFAEFLIRNVGWFVKANLAMIRSSLFSRPNDFSIQVIENLSKENADPNFVELVEECADEVSVCARESLLFGVDGLYQDFRAKGLSLPFTLEDVEVKEGFYLWVGERDQLTNIVDVRNIQRRLPNCHVYFTNSGHHSAIVHAWEGALDTLAEGLPSSPKIENVLSIEPIQV